MATNREAGAVSEEAPVRFTARAILSFVLVVVLLPLVLFLAAGTWQWTAAWVYVAIHIFMTFLSRVLVWRVHPSLLVERGRSVEKGFAQGRDRLLLPLAAVFGPLLTWIVAGLDERFAASPDLPLAVQAVAAGLLVLGYGVGAWAMVANAYFSAVVRIQQDRGQQVVTDGPYRWVRHPAYAGGVVAYLVMPLLLDSLWALIPAVLSAAAVVARTALEDRTLQAELPGYADYARRTRRRLMPGVW